MDDITKKDKDAEEQDALARQAIIDASEAHKTAKEEHDELAVLREEQSKLSDN